MVEEEVVEQEVEEVVILDAAPAAPLREVAHAECALPEPGECFCGTKRHLIASGLAAHPTR